MTSEINEGHHLMVNNQTSDMSDLFTLDDALQTLIQSKDPTHTMV